MAPGDVASGPLARLGADPRDLPACFEPIEFGSFFVSYSK